MIKTPQADSQTDSQTRIDIFLVNGFAQASADNICLYDSSLLLSTQHRKIVPLSSSKLSMKRNKENSNTVHDPQQVCDST